MKKWLMSWKIKLYFGHISQLLHCLMMWCKPLNKLQQSMEQKLFMELWNYGKPCSLKMTSPAFHVQLLPVSFLQPMLNGTPPREALTLLPKLLMIVSSIPQMSYKLWICCSCLLYFHLTLNNIQTLSSHHSKRRYQQIFNNETFL